MIQSTIFSLLFIIYIYVYITIYYNFCGRYTSIDGLFACIQGIYIYIYIYTFTYSTHTHARTHACSHRSHSPRNNNAWMSALKHTPVHRIMCHHTMTMSTCIGVTFVYALLTVSHIRYMRVIIIPYTRRLCIYIYNSNSICHVYI